MSRQCTHDLWRRFVNPDFVRLLDALDFGRCFVRAEGTKLYDDAGGEYTDFLAGFGVHNIGHNHPRVAAALRRAIDSKTPSMLNVDAPLHTGMLAQRLTSLIDPRLCRTAFANSGAEAVGIAIKAARMATGRRHIIACRNAYHGLMPGSLSLMGDDRRRRLFGPFLADVSYVAFGDIGALEDACNRMRPAAFFVEPIQGEGGVNIPDISYLPEAARVCRAVGCLLVVDEIQTGLGRTGAHFATNFQDCLPDVLLVGKALSGGFVPVAAAMIITGTWQRAFSGPDRCQLNASTFAGSLLAMVAGLETLSVLEDECLPARAEELGAVLLEGLRNLATRRDIIRDVRGRGLLAGIEFRAPEGLLTKAVPRWARDGLYAQVISALLLRDHGFLTQPCSLAPAVLRIEPPLVVSQEEIDRFLTALDRALATCSSHASAVIAAFRKRVLGWDL